MQYAEVLLNQRTKQWDASFLYNIPPNLLPNIKVGSLVIAPFHGRKIEGVVKGLKAGIPKSVKGKLRPIERIIQPDCQISRDEMNYAKFLAQKYLAGLGEALFAMIPNIPRKAKIDFGDIEKIRILNGKAYRHFLIMEEDEKRWKYYIQILKKINFKSRSALIVFADYLKLIAFKEYLEKNGLDINLMVYSSSGGIEERWEKWQKIRYGRAGIVLGTRMALLNPPPNLELVIVDEPNADGMFEEQAPRYQARELAQYLAKERNITLIEGEIIPTVIQWQEIKLKKIRLLNNNLPKPKAKIEIVNKMNEKGVISISLDRELENIVKRNGLAILFIPRKGYGTVTKCLDCDFQVKCEKCNIPLIYHPNKRKLYCHFCRGEKELPKVCPNCKGVNFKTFGFGTEKVEEWLKEKFSNRTKIIRLEKEEKLDKIPKSAIIVSTQAVFRYDIKFDLCGVLEADLLLNLPDYAASEETFRTLAHLSFMIKEKMIIQTNEPELDIYKYLQTGRYQNFWEKILIERKTNQYPPFGQLIKITLTDRDEEKVKDKIEKLKIEIEKISQGMTILGPSPSFIAKKKDIYYWQMIIKTSKIHQELHSLLSEENVKVEINPPSLL